MTNLLHYCDIYDARLIGATQPLINKDELELNDAKELILYCAKVSNPQFQTNFENGERLINYLIKHKHWSPFEMASATIEITTTRDIARQILRHRSFSFQEFSQRYEDVEKLDNAFVIRETRMQDNKNRQNSIETDDIELKKMWVAKQTQLIHEARLAYRWALDNGIAKEVARCVLPEGNTVSRLYMNGTIRSWIHFVELRSGNGTQKENGLVTRAVAEAISQVFPDINNFVNQ